MFYYALSRYSRVPMDRGRRMQRDRWENSRTSASAFAVTPRARSRPRVFSLSRLLCWRYTREIHLEECTRYVQATASRFHRCPRSPVRDRSLHASTGLNHKIVPGRLRNSTDLRAEPWLSCTLLSRRYSLST